MVSIKEGMNKTEMYKMFSEMRFKIGAEIGVWRGANAKLMFDIIPNLTLYLVDPYSKYLYSHRIVLDIHFQDAKEKAYKLVDGFNAIFIEKPSEDAIKDISDESLDFVFIDGNHEYDFVMQDIILWNRKVRKGGIISGDDYWNSHRGMCGVGLAVMHYTQQHSIDYFITDKRKEDQHYPSWYWIKDYWIYPW